MKQPPPDQKLTLRERNRLAAHDAIAEAAMQLCLKHGIDAVRVEDIAQEAGIALRTFRHYFSNKNEALIARHLAWMRVAAEVLRNRPEDEPLWVAIGNAFTSHWEASGDNVPSQRQLLELRLLFGDRNLQGEILKAGVAQDSEFSKVIAERCGLDPKTSPYPRMVAGSVTVVVLTAIDIFLNADPPVSVRPLVSESIEQLASGFPEPKRKKAVGAEAAVDAEASSRSMPHDGESVRAPAVTARRAKSQNRKL